MSRRHRNPAGKRARRHEPLIITLALWAADSFTVWATATLLWAWITYRTAQLELPSAVVITTAITAVAAYGAGQNGRRP